MTTLIAGAAQAGQTTGSSMDRADSMAAHGSSMNRESDSMAPSTGTNRIAATAVVGTVTGQALLRRLQRGGLILWIRHGARDDRPGDVSDAQAAAHNCAEQSRLTAQGKAQARAVGAGMRELNLPIAAVHAARLCRTRATARLLNVGPVKTDASLDEASTWHDRGGDAAYQQAVFKLLSTTPPKGKDILDVTSKLTVPNPRPPVLAALGPAEVAVFAPNPGGQPQLLARIGRKAWRQLAQKVGQ
ncbi:histidine phosphatase family protein [Salinisphaera hydrothermalis]|uniref:histidine phosphatase family protein n=1 Tax=Salinisphaera hydrothermalis TaxID=563188 RepID=UPI00333EF573